MRILLLVVMGLFATTISAQISLKKLKSASVKAQLYIEKNELSKEEVVKGLKEALIIGANNSTSEASRKGGFNKNSLIRIPFPEDAKKVKQTLVKLGMQTQVNNFEGKLNEAAEEASNYAKEIFIDAIKKMSINDAMGILKGDDNSATNYLKEQTFKELYLSFKPSVRNSIKKVRLTEYWSVLVNRYNAIPLTKEVNTDLEDYITNKTIEGLFVLIEKEEKNIRNNPKSRVSETLQRVFK